MRRFFVSKDDITSSVIMLHGEDAEHIYKVLRLRPGDEIIACDGDENEYICSIESCDKRSVDCRIIKREASNSEPPVKVHIFQAIPKSTKMDMIIQKCTELGMEGLTPVDTERVVAHIKVNGDKRDISNKISRWQRIAREASKQSGRGRIPEISDIVTYDEMLGMLKGYDLNIIPYEKESDIGLKQVLKGKDTIKNIALIIGPEGGFSEDEIERAKENGVFPITLGHRILRTETASLACLSMIMYALGDLGGGSWKE
ncbi:MAG TPA: 16S rRNA (uracil(1498)-N(3))-methyltransferase [Clostridiaceae bacterium]|nr:16S rRNA (uracil(1498)-N(3))-methyltransferase [Clostridiaceae bacterium]